MVPHRPHPLLESLIHQPEYESNVIYIQGDALLEKDLKRCCIEKAKAVIIETPAHVERNSVKSKYQPKDMAEHLFPPEDVARFRSEHL